MIERKMRIVGITLLLIGFNIIGNSQTCFDAYELLFVEENKTLPYNEFHKLELDFLENLIGCNAKDFNVTTIDGEELLLSALKGKVVVLNFWFTTCPPCLKEIPELNKMAEQYNSDEVVFIGFARDDQEKLEAFFKKFGTFNYLIVPESTDIADAYKVVGWPQSMVIDKEGKVAKSWAGLTETPQIMRKNIEIEIHKCLSQQ